MAKLSWHPFADGNVVALVKKKSGLAIWGESCYLVDCETGGGKLAGHLPLGNVNTKKEMP